MDANSHVGEESSPLLGAILCYTSVAPDQRGAMAAIAQQMGAVVKLDLTSDVTHLIVGNTDTAKYKYVAKERRDIVVLSPSWVEAVRVSWMEGGVTDVAALEREHRLPTFAGLHICVTGFDDLQQRSEIANAVQDNGATYQGDLTRSITHLIAATPHGKKYEYAGQWGIKIVAVEWLRDSLERGMVLDETLYHPLVPAEERGIGAVTFKEERSPQLGKRARTEEQTAPGGHDKRRKLRRVASAKLESQKENIWADIGGDENSVVKVPEDHWNEDTRSETHPEGLPSARKSPSTSRHTFHRGEQQALLASSDNLTGAQVNGVFGNSRLHIHGFDARKTGILHSHLEANGAKVILRQEMSQRPVRDESIAVIVPHDTTSEDMEQMKSLSFILKDDELVTDLWVERCLHNKILESTDFVLCKPLLRFPVKGFGKLIICPTAFSGIELLHFSKVVKLMGATYDECLRPETSVLVCNKSPNHAKLDYAVQKKIPTVSASWLWTCIERGVLLPYESFSTVRSSPSRQNEEAPSDMIVERPSPKQLERHRRIKPRSSAELPRGAPRGRLEFQRQSNKASEIAEDEEDKGQSSPSVLKPTSPRLITKHLQELAPAVNSPRNPSHSPSHSTKPNHSFDHTKAVVEVEQSFPSLLDHRESAVELEMPMPNPPSPEPSPQSNGLHEAIEHLLAQKRAAVAAAAASTSFDPLAAAAKASRSRRKLGRAPSDTDSIRAGAGSLSRNASIDVPLVVGSIPEDEAYEDIAQAQPGQRETYLFRPSQALSYEDPEALAAREKLLKRMGLASYDEEENLKGMTKVESIGIIKNVGRAGGADSGSRRRTTRRR